VENPTSKNNDLMSIDSAVWYIEALLNYQYGIITDSSEVYYETKTDSAFFSINTTAGKIEIMDVVSAFYEIETVVVDGLKDIKHQNKRIDIIDIEYKNEQSVAYFQYNFGEQVFGGKYLYNITDNWQWGQKLGTCSGQYIYDKDLTNEIMKWIKYNRAVYNVTWTNISQTNNEFVTDGGITSNYGFSTTDLSAYGVHMFSMYKEDENGFPQHMYNCVYSGQANYFYAPQILEIFEIIEDNYLPNEYKVISTNDYLYTGTVFWLDWEKTKASLNHVLDVIYGKPNPITYH